MPYFNFVPAVVPTLGYLLSTLGLDFIRPYLWHSSATPSPHLVDPEALVCLASTATPTAVSPTRAQYKHDQFKTALFQGVASSELLYDSDGDASAADTESATPRVLRQGSSDSYFRVDTLSNTACIMAHTPTIACVSPRTSAPSGALRCYQGAPPPRHPNQSLPRPASSLLCASVMLHKTDGASRCKVSPRHTGDKSGNHTDGSTSNLAIEDSITVPVSSACTRPQLASSTPYDEWTSQDAERPRYRRAIIPQPPSLGVLLGSGRNRSPDVDRNDADTSPLLPSLRPARPDNSSDGAAVARRTYKGEEEGASDKAPLTHTILGFGHFFTSKSSVQCRGAAALSAHTKEDAISPTDMDPCCFSEHESLPLTNHIPSIA